MVCFPLDINPPPFFFSALFSGHAVRYGYYAQAYHQGVHIPSLANTAAEYPIY